MASSVLCRTWSFRGYGGIFGQLTPGPGPLKYRILSAWNKAISCLHTVQFRTSYHVFFIQEYALKVTSTASPRQFGGLSKSWASNKVNKQRRTLDFSFTNWWFWHSSHSGRSQSTMLSSSNRAHLSPSCSWAAFYTLLRKHLAWRRAVSPAMWSVRRVMGADQTTTCKFSISYLSTAPQHIPTGWYHQVRAGIF